MEQVYAIMLELASQLGDPLGPAQPLGSGGRDYRVRMTTGEYVVRLPRKNSSPFGTSREAERLANQMAASLAIAPEVVAAGPDWLVTRFLDRPRIDPERLRADPEPVALALRAFHQSRLQLPTRSWIPEQLDRLAAIVQEHRGSLPDAYADTRTVVARVAEVLPLTDPLPSHNNLRPVNVLELAPASSETATHRIMLVDWEHAAMGHFLADLATLAVHNGFDERAEERLLAAYFGEQPGDARLAELALMRVVAHARDWALALAQDAQSGPNPALEARASEHLEALLRVAGDPRFEGWLRSASG